MKIDFSKYKSPIFLETGSYLGDGISAAIQAGFEEIYSIELSRKYYEHCKRKFSRNPNVHIIFGDSALMLSSVIAPIDRKITFWLDGHYSSGDTACGTYKVPLIYELEQMKAHPIKAHTILIDDIRLLRTKQNEFCDVKECVSDVENIITSINRDYTITYIDGITSNDIMVAQV